MNRQRDTLRSVKVDNWGTFFLQKLLNFFNKTDYCDLTLQFLDNSQLKVHRLVLSACTDYFNILEQTCEMVEDILIMPKDLQADTILPIVNFMYTGSLEFHYSMYEKLLKTSREMNMTVLSKLLEAHRETSSITKSTQPVLLNKNAASANNRSQPKVFHQKPLPTKTVIYKQGQTIIKHVSPNKQNIPEPIQIVSRYQTDKTTSSRPSRFIVPDEIIVPDTEGSFETISYESKPLQTASQLKNEDENSTFESLRRGYTNKRATTALSSAPPSKKPNLDDIKELAEAQSQRNELIGDEDSKVNAQNTESIQDEEASDDDDYDGDQYFDDEGSEDEYSKNQKNSPSTVVKQTTKQITVSDCSGGNIDHAKILGEVLKKYPNLVKNPKNIKLKIMQKPSQSNSSQTTAIVRVVKQDDPKIVTSTPQLRQPKKIDAKTMHELIRMGAENQKGPWLCLECGTGGRPISIPSYKKFRAHLINIHKQKIDPRICEHCGLKPAKRIELIQHQLIAHNINPPSDVTLFRCTTKGCVFVTQKEDLLMKHKREIHKEFQQKCSYCSKVFNKEFLLHAHLRAVHRHKAKTDGMMEFSEDEEYDPTGGSSKDTQYATIVEKSSGNGNKIEILSNIEIPTNEAINIVEGTVITASSEAEALSNVASGIATSMALVDNVVIEDQFNIEKQLAQMHNEYEEPKKPESTEIITRLVAEDGTEMVLTQEQKEEILQQLQQQGANLSDNVVMVLDQRQLSVDDQNNGIMVMLNEDPSASALTESIQNNENVTSSTTIKPEEIENAEIVFQDDTINTKDEEDNSGKTRLKLIADLEDDWTEDGATDELKEEKQSIEVKLKSDSKIEEKQSVSEATESKNDSSELNSLLQDWDCDINKKETTSDAEKADDSIKENDVTKNSTKELDEEEEQTQPVAIEKAVTEDDDDDDDDDEEKIQDEGKKDTTTSEKSKIINELLDEWNDL